MDDSDIVDVTFDDYTCISSSENSTSQNGLDLKKINLLARARKRNTDISICEEHEYSVDRLDEIAKLMKKASKTPLLDGTFFQVIPEKSELAGIIVARCRKCSQKKEIKGTFASTSNYRSHLQRIHGKEYLNEFERYKRTKIQIAKTTLHGNSDDSETPQSVSSRKSSIINKNQSKCVFSQEQFENDLLNYIIKSLCPLSTVENEYFRRIFDNICIPDQKHISRRTVVRRLTKLYAKNEISIIRILKEIDYVCTTADVWSTKQRRFLGVTAHWINRNTLQRKSVVLACRRFPGMHSYNRLAQLLEEINTHYKLNCIKIVATVTDNGSNFVKAFNEYGLQTSQNEEFNDLSFEELPSFFETERFLPMHIRCCSHTLSLIATIDVMKKLKENALLQSVHNEVLRKCSILWTASSHPKFAEVIKETLGFILNRPVVTRWNSMFDALSKLLAVKNKLPLLIEKFRDNPSFTESELAYLEEHIKCMNPLAVAIDRLQGEKNLYYGYVLPSLLELKKKCERLLKEELRFCRPILLAIVDGLEKRFRDFLSLGTVANNAIISTFSHPIFKGRWLAAVESCERDRLRSLFIQAVAKEHKKANPPNIDIEENDDDDFYFGSDNISEKPNISNGHSQAEIEALRYMNDSRRDLSMLNDYPSIKEVFLRYNTPLPSSAPVERLFSFATMTNLPRYGSLKDELFEFRVILKANDIL